MAANSNFESTSVLPVCKNPQKMYNPNKKKILNLKARDL